MRAFVDRRQHHLDHLSAGWWLALAHITTAIALAVTIIGIPLAWANIKLIPVSLVPLGRGIEPVEAGQEPRNTGVALTGSLWRPGSVRRAVGQRPKRPRSAA